jgi:hypothetical protein
MKYKLQDNNSSTLYNTSLFPSGFLNKAIFFHFLSVERITTQPEHLFSTSLCTVKPKSTSLTSFLIPQLTVRNAAPSDVHYKEQQLTLLAIMRDTCLYTRHCMVQICSTSDQFLPLYKCSPRIKDIGYLQICEFTIQ